MRIKQITIYGFGKWVDVTFDLTKGSFHCIQGRNESGKSTLQNFILFILFGLPPKQRKFFQPKTSSKMGGRLTLLDEEIGEYTIERMDGSSNGRAICMLPDGSVYDEQWLSRQLKGMNKEVYESIFSFSAQDLEALRKMKEEDFGAILLGIGLTGSSRIYLMEKKLDRQLGALFKPTGKIPQMNEQMDKLDKLYEDMISCKTKEATYESKRREQQQIEYAIKKVEKELQEEKEQQISMEKKQRAQPFIHKYLLIEKREKNVPAAIPFPIDGRSRLQRLKEQLLPIESEINVLKHTEEHVHMTYKKLEKRKMTEEHVRWAQEIIQNKHLFFSWQQEITEVKQKIKTIMAGLDEGVKELQIELTQADLQELTFPFHIEYVWNELKQKSEQIQIEYEQVEDEVDLLTKQKQRIQQEISSREKEQLSDDQVEALEKQINTQKEYHLREHVSKTNVNKQANWKKNKDRKLKGIKRLCFTSIIIAIFTCIVALVFSIHFLYIVALFIFIIGLGQLLLQKQSIKSTEQLLLDDLYVLDEGSANRFENIQEVENKLMLTNRIKDQIQNLKEQQRATEIHRIKWTERQLQLKQRKEQLRQQINEQQGIYPFLKLVHVSYWSDLLLRLKELKEMQEVLRQLENKQKDRERKIERFTSNIKRYFQAVGQTETTEIEQQIRIIQAQIKENNQTEISEKEQQNILYHNKVKQGELKEKARVYTNEINSLYNEARVSSEEEFYQQAKYTEEKHSLKNELKGIEEQLSRIFGKSNWLDFIPYNEGERFYENKLEDSNLRIKQREERLVDLIQQLADIKAILRDMEGSDRYFELSYRFTMEKETLKQKAKEWAILKTAKEMLKETKQTYEDKYAHLVIAKATVYFQKITNGKYIKVHAPSNESTFTVESSDHIYYDVMELSKGTLDQLYIALRFSISEIMSEKHKMPFILDDVFIHFDDVRLETILEIIETIAKKQQVILFTCKKEVMQNVKAANCIHLER